MKHISDSSGFQLKSVSQQLNEINVDSFIQLFRNMNIVSYIVYNWKHFPFLLIS